MEHIKTSYFCFFTHPELTRFTSGELCPSLCKKRGEDTVRWLGVSELKYYMKYFPFLIFCVFASLREIIEAIVLLPLLHQQ